MDLRHLEHLQHARTLLTAKGIDTTHARPACFSGAGFSEDLRAAERRGEVIPIESHQVYSDS